MTPDRFNADQALAARKVIFETAASHLRANGVVIMAEQVAKDIPGAEVSVVDIFQPQGEMFPLVRLKGLAEMTERPDGRNGIVEEQWVQSHVVVWSNGNMLRMHRGEESWTQRPGRPAERNRFGGFRTGDILFDPTRGADLLKQGLVTDAIFPDFLPTG